MEFLQLIQQVPAFHFYSKQKKGRGGGGGALKTLYYTPKHKYTEMQPGVFLVKWQSLSVLQTPLE